MRQAWHLMETSAINSISIAEVILIPMVRRKRNWLSMSICQYRNCIQQALALIIAQYDIEIYKDC